MGRILTAAAACSDPLFSIIVTTYNSPTVLRASLRSLARQTDLGFEAVVADDGSTAETADMLSGLCETRLLRHGVRRKLGGCSSPVLHLWHERAPRSQDSPNFRLFRELLDREGSPARAADGMAQAVSTS